MKIEDIPQDASHYYGGVKRRIYAIDRSGHHIEADQSGWSVECDANELAWMEIRRKVHDAERLVALGQASPLAVHLEARMSSLGVLWSQTHILPWRLWAALKPRGYMRLTLMERQRLEKALRLPPASLDSLEKYQKWMET